MLSYHQLGETYFMICLPSPPLSLPKQVPNICQWWVTRKLLIEFVCGSLCLWPRVIDFTHLSLRIRKRDAPELCNLPFLKVGWYMMLFHLTIIKYNVIMAQQLASLQEVKLPLFRKVGWGTQWDDERGAVTSEKGGGGGVVVSWVTLVWDGDYMSMGPCPGNQTHLYSNFYDQILFWNAF